MIHKQPVPLTPSPSARPTAASTAREPVPVRRMPVPSEGSQTRPAQRQVLPQQASQQVAPQQTQPAPVAPPQEDGAGLATGASQLQQLLDDIAAAQKGRNTPKVSRASLQACRTALDIVLLNTVIYGDPQAKLLAQQAWQDAKQLSETGMMRLAARMENREKRNTNGNQ